MILKLAQIIRAATIFILLLFNIIFITDWSIDQKNVNWLIKLWLQLYKLYRNKMAVLN